MIFLILLFPAHLFVRVYCKEELLFLHHLKIMLLLSWFVRGLEKNFQT